MKENIETLNKIIGQSNMTIFCGSGISFGSNIPGVNAIINSLIAPLIALTQSFSHNWVNRIVDRSNGLIIQFEVIMGYIRQEIGTDVFAEFLKQVFDTKLNGYIPNNLHKSIAILAKKGIVKNIYTTNFDTLIEQALKDERIAYNSISDDETLDSESVNVIKIHGCISKPETILTTMQEVSRNANKSIERLENCFIGEGVVLFLGYSCSDFADIKPAIRMIGENNIKKKKIIVLNHCESNHKIMDFDDLRNCKDSVCHLPDIKKIKSYFINDDSRDFFRGLVIRGNTNVLPICLNMPKDDKTKNTIRSSLYVNYIKDYYKKQKEYKIFWIVGNLCEKLGEYTEAISYIKHSLVLANNNNEQLCTIVRINMDLAVALYRHSDHKAAIATIDRYLDDAILCFGYNSEEVAQLYDNLGLNYVHIQEGGNTAVKMHNTALNIANSIPGDKKSLIGNISNNLGNAYFDIGNYDDSLNCYNRAMAIFKELYSEQDSSVATAMNNIGGIYLKLRNYALALKSYSDAYEIWNHTLSSNHPNIAIAIANIGDVYYKQKEYRNACIKHLSALRIRLRTLDYPHFDLFESYERLGDCCYKLKRLSIALKCYTTAQRYCRDNDDIPTLTKRQVAKKHKLLTELIGIRK